mgnify:CR=1 FL=1
MRTSELGSITLSLWSRAVRTASTTDQTVVPTTPKAQSVQAASVHSSAASS